MRKTCVTKFAILWLLFLTLVLSFLIGCKSTAIPLQTATTAPYIARLDIQPVPKIGETVELIFTISVKDAWLLPKGDLANAKAWLEFYWTNIHGSYSEARRFEQVPVSEVLVNGTPTWEGNALDNKLVKIAVTIELPREGIWRIEGHLVGEGSEGGYLGERIQVAVADGTAGIMYRRGFSKSPIGYLENFTYGLSGIPLPDENRPMGLEADISKVPQINEEILLSCRLISPFSDISDMLIKVYFHKRIEGTDGFKEIPGENFLVSGALLWQHSLIKDQPLELTSTIKFPEEGEWKIYIDARDIETGEQVSDTIKFTINHDKSYYGWKPVYVTRPEPFNWTPVVIGIVSACIIGGLLLGIFIARKRNAP